MLGNVLKNFGSLTTMRILSRLLHFALKTYLIRTQLDQQILAHLLNLDLILTTSLHVIRSCFKPSYQKIDDNNNIVQSSMNIMTFGILATIISALIVSGMEYFHFISSGKSLAYFSFTIALYAISAVCESVAQKFMVECVIKYEYFKIGVIEVASVIPKTIFIFFASFLNWFSSYGILVFGVGQIIYSVCLMVIFFGISKNKAILLQPFTDHDKVVYFDPKSKSSLKQFSALSFLKLILQQFQRIVLVVMDISHVSSIYSLISNLGSVIVRYLFSPLNQIIYNYFSRDQQNESIQAFIKLIKSTLIFSIVSTSFGYNYSQIFLIFLYGQRWVNQESISAMRTYMTLIIFLGFNGIIQAFLFAKGKESISKYNYFSIITTAIYLGATIGFLNFGLGASGLFLGNIVNMSLRIVVCWVLQISKHIRFVDLLREVRPSLLYVLVSIVIFFIGHKQYGFAQTIFTYNILKFIGGGCLFGLNLLPIIYQNREYLIAEFKHRLLGSKSQKKQ